MATHEDAVLMVQLFRWSTELGLDAAASEVLADKFNAADASMDNRSVRTLLTFGECVGTLVKNNLLDRDLVGDAWAFELVWSRLAAAAVRERTRLNEPRLYENFEALTTATR